MGAGPDLAWIHDLIDEECAGLAAGNKWHIITKGERKQVCRSIIINILGKDCLCNSI